MKRFTIICTILLLFTLTGCDQGINSPEEIGEEHFEMYFAILSDEDVDINGKCNLLYAEDFVEKCKLDMTETKEMLEYRVLTKEDYELIEVTSEIMDDMKKEALGLSTYNQIFEVTITYKWTLLNGDDYEWVEWDYSIFVIEIDGEYKAVIPEPNLVN